MAATNLAVDEPTPPVRPLSAFTRSEPPLQPPITSESLAELDMPRMINNPKLRHDVNFDHDLHFRPNLDSTNGHQRSKQVEEYWKGLNAELAILAHPMPLNPSGRFPGLIMEPGSCPISQKQSKAEAEGIYAGLVRVEAKCVNFDASQVVQSDPPKGLVSDQWQALVALHRMLLHEHHDFSTATAHPPASEAVRGLAAKLDTPAREWEQVIHLLFGLWKHWHPDSLDHMLAFVYFGFHMMALRFEALSTFIRVSAQSFRDFVHYSIDLEREQERHVDQGIRVASFFARSPEQQPLKTSPTEQSYHYADIRKWRYARPLAEDFVNSGIVWQSGYLTLDVISSVAENDGWIMGMPDSSCHEEGFHNDMNTRDVHPAADELSAAFMDLRRLNIQNRMAFWRLTFLFLRDLIVTLGARWIMRVSPVLSRRGRKHGRQSHGYVHCWAIFFVLQSFPGGALASGDSFDNIPIEPNLDEATKSSSFLGVTLLTLPFVISIVGISHAIWASRAAHIHAIHRHRSGYLSMLSLILSINFYVIMTNHPDSIEWIYITLSLWLAIWMNYFLPECRQVGNKMTFLWSTLITTIVGSLVFARYMSGYNSGEAETVIVFFITEALRFSPIGATASSMIFARFLRSHQPLPRRNSDSERRPPLRG